MTPRWELPRAFTRIMLARFSFTFAVQMQAVVLGWLIYDIKRDPLYLGFIGLVEAIPALSLALYAGYFVDRSRPLQVYRGVMCGSLLSGVVLFLSCALSSRMDSSGTVLTLYAAAFLTGTARAFSQPSLYSIVPRIVRREDLPHASAWTTSVMQLARISGPAAGGLLFGFFGAPFTAAMICACLCIALAATLGVTLPGNSGDPSRSAKRLPSREEFFSGAKFVFRHPILFPALTLDMISVLFGGVTAILPIYAREILDTGPRGLGILRASPAIGAAVMSLLVLRMNIRTRAGKKLFASVAGFGISILVFAVSRNFLLSIAALALSGAFDSVSMVIRTSAVQLASPDDMRGRISAVNSIFIGSSNELGEMESGLAAKLLGTVPSVLFGGVMCLLTVASMGWLASGLREMDLDRIRDRI